MHETVIGVPQTTTVTRTVQVRVGIKTVRTRVSFQVESVQRLMSCGAASPCDLAFEQLTIAPAGHTGRHTHFGPTLVSVVQGEGTLYHGVAGCPARKYATGTSFFQPTTEVHNLRNEGSEPLVVLALYYLPAGHRTAGSESTSRSLRAARQSRRSGHGWHLPRAARSTDPRPWCEAGASGDECDLDALVDEQCIATPPDVALTMSDRVAIVIVLDDPPAARSLNSVPRSCKRRLDGTRKKAI
jgi:quercetin dioxygenase-like cupin family protein